MATENAGRNPSTPLQTVFLEFLQISLVAKRHSFLKRKKQFAKGRAIISYAQSLCSKLLEMASIVLTVMAKTLYSDTTAQVCKACLNCGNLSTGTGPDPVRKTMSNGMTTSSDSSMQCLTRTSCDRYKPLFASTSSLQAAQFSRLICCPRQDTRVVPEAEQSPA